MAKIRFGRGLGLIGAAVAVTWLWLGDSSVARAGTLGDAVKSELPPEINTAAGDAADIAGAYTGVAGYVDGAISFLRMTGLIEASADPVAQQFVALNQHLDATAGALGWMFGATERERRLADAEFAVVSAREIFKSTGKALDINSPTAFNSGTVVAEAESDIAFERYFFEKATDGAADWKRIIPDRPTHDNGVVYDWRFGVPALMRTIALRIQVMAAVDPNFRHSGVFTSELIMHRNALMSQIAKMLDGVRCSDLSTYYDVNCYPTADSVQCDTRAQHEFACADIYTGTAVFGPALDVPLSYDNEHDPAWIQANVQSTLNRLRGELLAQLPLADMYAMSQSLLTYANIPAELMLTGGSDWSTLPVASSVGNGTFTINNADAGDFASWAQETGATPIRGDFDRDGRQDVALVGVAGWTTIPIAFDNGDGTFRITNAGVPDFPFSSSISKPVSGDFNGDGRTDIALVGGSQWTTVPLALSNGDGTFTLTNRYLNDFPAWANAGTATPVSGDFNADGRSDIALVGVAGWDTIPVAFSNSDGTFTVSNQQVSDFPIWASWGAVQPVAGDFNGDGFADIALTGRRGWSTVPVAFSNGDGTFNVTNAGVASFPDWAATQGAIAVSGDFNGDGLTDIALTGGVTASHYTRSGLVPGGPWGSVPIAYSSGDGTFTTSNKNVWHFAGWAAQAGVLAVGSLHPSFREFSVLQSPF